MNELKVTQQQTIIALHQQGWSKRKIARDLSIDRQTVRRYLAGAEAKSPVNPQAGSASENPKPPTNPQTGALALGGSGPDSLCEPWKERIQAALVAGLSVQRIFQDLVAEEQFVGSYYSVRRLALRLSRQTELPFRRLEVEPGAELQVDFGQGAWVVENGRRKRPHRPAHGRFLHVVGAPRCDAEHRLPDLRPAGESQGSRISLPGLHGEPGERKGIIERRSCKGRPDLSPLQRNGLQRL